MLSISDFDFGVRHGLRHIGIIMDGNRRFAKRLMKQPWKGHEWGSKKIKDVLNWCREAKIKTATIYAFSVQNFSRPKMEFNYLMGLFKKEFLDITKPGHDVHKYKIKVRAIGRIWMLPKFVQAAIEKAEKATADYKKFLLNIAIAYGGQEEITDAFKSLAKKVLGGLLKPEEINEHLIRHSLYTNGATYPDLILRTGGEHRLSNFLTWQSAYSELIFIDKCWPEMTKQDFLGAIEEFKNRERRFGK